MSEVRCYNCQQLGHYSGRCPLPRKSKEQRTAYLTVVKSLGDFEKEENYWECDEVEVDNPIEGYTYYSSEEVEIERPVGTTELVQAADKRDKRRVRAPLPLMITATLGTQVFVGGCVIDTGATTSCINTRFMETKLLGPMKDQFRPQSQRFEQLFGADNKQLTVVGIIVLSMMIGAPELGSQHQVDITFRVVDQLACKFLIGLDMMKTLIKSIHIDRNLIEACDGHRATQVPFYKGLIKPVRMIKPVEVNQSHSPERTVVRIERDRTQSTEAAGMEGTTAEQKELRQWSLTEFVDVEFLENQPRKLVKQ